MYREPARYCDRVYASKDYASESSRVAEEIRSGNPRARTLLDVACGASGHREHLQSEFICDGLDVSPEMLDVAQSKVPAVDLHIGGMSEFSLGKKFDVVVCLFSAVGHLVTVDRLNAAVRRMSQHLEPGGVLIVEPW